MFAPRIAVVASVLLVASLSGCGKDAPQTPAPRPVRAVTVQASTGGEPVSFTGQIRAKDQTNLAFRVDGRIVERLVNVGDTVVTGQVVAKLDPQNQHNNLDSAQANLAAAQAQLTQARLTYSRQQELLKGGWTPRAKFDDAEQAFKSATAQVEAAQAQLRIAQDQLGYTDLVADAAGVITAVGAESGEVVRAGHMIVQLAHEGARDAVFDVSERAIRTGPRDPLVEITLVNDPQTKAIGRVREVAPEADNSTRTFQVKVAIANPPPAMRLGATVTGSIKLAAPTGVDIPAGALTLADGSPAVWVVDPHSQKVSLRPVKVTRYDPATVVVSQGLEEGEIVVTAGVQTLHPGQQVRVLGAAS